MKKNSKADKNTKKKLIKKQKLLKGFTKTRVKVDALSTAYSLAGKYGNDLHAAGKYLFENVLVSMKTEEFYEKYFEKNFFLLNRKDSKFYADLFSVDELRIMLNSGRVHPDDASVTRYDGSAKETKAFERLSWETDLSEGWSIRLYRPQSEHENIWKLCSLLEAFWGQTAGANVYWTPKASQGFAPHFDDVDVFILQIEGYKRWMIFEPSDKGQFPILPLQSSLDFTKDDLKDLKLKLEVVLNPGDILYLPRGWIHYAESLHEADSLHVTVSMGSNTMTYSSLLEKLFLQSLQSTVLENVELRKSLPLNFEQYMGMQNLDVPNEKRDILKLTILKMANQIINRLDDFVDLACDGLVGDFMYDRHRPAREDFEEDEEASVDSFDTSKIRLESIVQLNVIGSARICIEGDLAIVRHCMKNTRVFHEIDPRGIEFDIDDAPAIEAALTTDIPFSIGSLPKVLCDEDEDDEEIDGRIRVVCAMINERILNLVKY